MRTSRPEKVVFVTQGTYHLSEDPQVVLTAILGSCIATCLFDPIARLGGMNHFLLPGDAEGSAQVRRHGRDLTQALIRDLERLGASRARLVAKVFGGGRMIAGMVNIGALNADFADGFLSSEGIEILTRSVGGDRARRIRFWPTTGRARQLLLDPIVHGEQGQMMAR